MRSYSPPNPQPYPAIPLPYGFNIVSPSLIGLTQARSSSQPSGDPTSASPSFTVTNQNPVILYAIACPPLLPITETAETIICTKWSSPNKSRVAGWNLFSPGIEVLSFELCYISVSFFLQLCCLRVEIMGEAERPLSFRYPFYSARLLIRVASRRKFFISLSKTDRVVRPKVSVPSLHPIDEKGFEAGASGGDDYLNPKPQNVSPDHGRQHSGRTQARSRSGCYLCTFVLHLHTIRAKLTWYRMRYNATRKLEQASSSNIRTSARPHVKYLPLSRSQPPIVPRRSTSLPYFKHVRKYKLTTNLSKALTTFRLSRTEGPFFQYLVYHHTTTSLHDFHDDFKDSIWSLILQISTTEPLIRRLAIHYAFLSRFATISEQSKPTKTDTQTQHRLSRQYKITASQHSFSLSVPDPSIAAAIYELALLATYIQTICHICLKDEHRANFWLQRGYHILHSTLLRFSQDPDGDGEDLPGNMRDIGLAFERLNLWFPLSCTLESREWCPEPACQETPS